MAFQVLMHPKAAKTLAKFPKTDKSRVKSALKRLAEDPYTSRPGAQIKHLKGTQGREDLYRVRIGNYRAIYSVQEDEILVTDIFVRGRGYDI